MFNRGYVLGFAALAVAASALLAVPAVALASGDTVIATVNGDKILKKDVEAAIKTLPPQSGADQKALFPAVVDQIINEKLIDDATNSARVEQSEDFKKAMDTLKSQLAKKIYLDKYLKNKVSDSAIHAEYDKFKEENKGKQEVHARHILVKTEAEATQAIKDLDGGAKFEDLVKQRSSDSVSASHGGDLGWFTKDEMVPAFSDAAFKLSPGEYSKEPVKSQFGWHVIKVEDKRSREVPPMDQVAPAIRQKLAQDAVKDLIMKLRAKAQIKMFDAEGNPLAYGGGSKGKHASKSDAAPATEAGDDAPAAAAAKPADDSKYNKVEDSDKPADAPADAPAKP